MPRLSFTAVFLQYSQALKGINMKIIELVKNLDALIPRELSEEWDNDGMMLVTDKEREISRAVVTLDVTPDCIEYAKAQNANLIVSHHPFIFKPLASIAEDLKSRMIVDLIRSGISVISYHTRFGGMNDVLAEALGIENAVELDVMARVGDLPDTMSPEELASYVSECLSADVVLYNGSNTVSRLAVLGGGGKDFVFPAFHSGADAIVTGDLSHSIALEAMNSGMTVVDAGHYGTEKIFINAFPSFLEKAGLDTDKLVKFRGSDPRVLVVKEN